MRREKPVKLYVTFYTYAEAMAMDAACKRANIGGKLASIPRKLSAGCGVAWECSLEPTLRSFFPKRILSLKKWQNYPLDRM